MEIEFVSPRGRYFLELNGQPKLSSDALKELCDIRFGRIKGDDLMIKWGRKYGFI